MEQSQIKLGIISQVQVFQRGIVCFVVPLFGDGQMYPRYRPGNLSSDTICNVDEMPGILRLAEMLVAGIAIAKVNTGFNPRGHQINQSGQTRGYFIKKCLTDMVLRQPLQ